MAIYHCSVKVIGRSSGRSSVGASAYRSGEKLYNQYDGITHDYRKKSGIGYSEILIPANAPIEFLDRQTLWNAVEIAEKRINSQTAREIEVALPDELTRLEQVDLIRSYVNTNFVDKGMCVDYSIHNKLDGNPHAHIMLTTRNVDINGFTTKNREWNNRENVELWRENWAVECNRTFERLGLDQRLDHRSYKRQGIDLIPTKHLGKAHQMEKRGITTERGTMNREIIEINIDKVRLEKEYQQLRKESYLEREALESERKANIRPLDVETRESKAMQGTIQNPARNDERETRNWQRSDGLERVEPAVAKETEMTIDSKPKQQTESYIKPIAELRQLPSENAGQRLSEIKQMYVNRNLAIEDYNNKKEQLSKLESRADRILENTQNIKNFESKIQTLQEKADGLNLLQFKEKKKYKSEIEKYQNSKAQAESYLEKNYGIKVSDVSAAINKIDMQRTQIKNEMPTEKQLSEYRQDRETFKTMYIAEKQTAIQRSDYKDIENAEKKNDTKFKGNYSMSDRMELAQIESKGKNPSKQDLMKANEIYKDKDLMKIAENKEKQLHNHSIGHSR